MLQVGPRGRYRAPAPVARFPTLAAALFAALGLSGCARPVMPDPRAAARQYADAARRGDADAIYGMLSDEARREFGIEGTRSLVKDSRAELARNAASLAAEHVAMQARARVRFEDGEVAVLQLEDGRFKIDSASAFPAGARTPAEALAELRQALARRSYAALVRVLSGETRGSLESDLRSLVDGLEHPDTLDVKVTGDSAVVRIPGGHSVTLKREAGVWRIDDFD